MTIKMSWLEIYLPTHFLFTASNYRETKSLAYNLYLYLLRGRPTFP